LGTVLFVSAIRLRRQLVRCRRSLTVMAAVLALATAIALHHSGIAMGGMHADHGMTAAIEMCLGVMSAIGAAVLAVAIGVLALGRWRPAPVLTPVGLALQAHPPLPRARAGPPLLCLLCISRR
jgi:hypothetical protein